MSNMIHYLSLQSEDLQTPEQETSPPFDNDNGQLSFTYPNEIVVGMVGFICCVICLVLYVTYDEFLL